MRVLLVIACFTLAPLGCRNPATIEDSPPSVWEQGISESDTVQKAVSGVNGPPTACPEFYFTSPQHQADSLMAIYEKRSKANHDIQETLDWAFFCAFPDTFAEMRKIFGYDENLGAAPLYTDGKKIIDYFKTLTAIPKELYYDKYVGININGVWEADNIRDAFGLARHLESNTRELCQALLKRTDDEIKSVFRFIFDGPHPINQVNKDTYEKLFPLLSTESKELGRLFSEAYLEVLATHDGHGN